METVYRFLLVIAAFIIPSEAQGGAASAPDATDPSNFIRWNSGSQFDDSAVARYITKQLQKLFRGNIRAQKYKPLKQKKIKCPSDLNCNFYRHNGSCNWHNVDNDGGRGATNLFLGKGKPDTKNATWMLVMGSNETPNPPFGIVVSQQTKSSIWWVSNPIPKQPGDGVVTLKHWISPQASMKICARLYDRATDPKKRKKPYTFITCSKRLYYDVQHGPTALKIRGPIKQTFELVMVFGPWPLKQGGMIIIDDIKYKSGLCRN